jgi:hypothetical protein
MITKQELLDAIKDGDFKFMRLVDPLGQAVVLFNNPKDKPATRIDKILNVINSEIYPPGMYKVELKQALKSSSVFIPIKKGDLSQAPLNLNDGTTNSLLQTLISEIKATNEKIALLEEELFYPEGAQSESELRDQSPKQEIVQPVKEPYSWIGEVVKQALPVLDRAFDIADKKITLSEKKMNPVNHNLAATFYNMLEVISNGENGEAQVETALKNLQISDPKTYQQVLVITLENSKHEQSTGQPENS